MRNILAIARLTISEGVRMRLVLVFAVVLVFIMLRLPFTLQGDDTLTGRLQTFLSYSLSAVSLLLGLSCVFLSCATLTNEIKNCSIHLVVTKPVSRFQILAGKWLGVNVLMTVLVLLCGLTIYGFARFIKSGPAANERDKISIRDVVWRGRVAAAPTPPGDLLERAREWVKSQIKQGQDYARGEQYAVVEKLKDLQNDWRTLGPGDQRVYRFDNLVPPRSADAAIQVRYRARGVGLGLDELVRMRFVFVDPDNGEPLGGEAFVDPDTGQYLAGFAAEARSQDRHQFLVRGQSVIKEGRTALLVTNLPRVEAQPVIHFDSDDGLEILYNVGTFEENYVKTLLIIIGRLAFLSAVGLTFGVFVSFPVACLCACTFYVVCMGMPFWLESIGANMEVRLVSIDPYGHLGPAIRFVLVPLLKFAFPNFALYDGARHLIDGEFIRAGLLCKALLHTLIYGGVLLFVPGWLVFRSREIAEVTV